MALVIDYKELNRSRGKSQPLYQQIREHLLTQINQPKIHKGERLPSISEMVGKWKVDYQTINNALQSLESEGLIQRQPGRGKGPIVIKRTERRHEVVFIRWSNDSMLLGITEGIQQFTSKKDMNFGVLDVYQSLEQFVNVVKNPGSSVDGLITLPHQGKIFQQALSEAVYSGLKVVFVDLINDMPVSSVSIDHASGAYQTTKHLLVEHNLPVYCLGTLSMTVSSIKDRLSGWLSAMHEYGFSNCDSYIYGNDNEHNGNDSLPNTYKEILNIDNSIQMEKECEFTDNPIKTLENSYNAAIQILKQNTKDRCSIFVSTSFAAMGVYLAADKLKLKIGTDLFVAGFGDHPLCQNLPVPLTIVKQDNTIVGYEAAKILLMELDSHINHHINKLLPAKLIIRQSSLSSPVNR